MKTLPTTWEGICEKEGINPAIPDVSQFPTDMQDYMTSCYQLPIVTKSLNDGWVPDYTDDDQPKYELRFRVTTDKENPQGVGLVCHDYFGWLSTTYVGPRFCFRDYDTMIHAVENFKPLFEQHHLLSK